jgi:hypothetical protein
VEASVVAGVKMAVKSSDRPGAISVPDQEPARPKDHAGSRGYPLSDDFNFLLRND